MKAQMTWDQRAPAVNSVDGQMNWAVEANTSAESTYSETKVGWHDIQSAVVMLLIVCMLLTGGFLLTLYRQNQILDTIVTTCVPRVEVSEIAGK